MVIEYDKSFLMSPLVATYIDLVQGIGIVVLIVTLLIVLKNLSFHRNTTVQKVDITIEE